MDISDRDDDVTDDKVKQQHDSVKLVQKEKEQNSVNPV